MKRVTRSVRPSKAVRRPAVSKAVAARAADVKLFLCDVDGVLTDASVFIGQNSEIKRFNIQDGLGLRLLQKTGIRVGWISNRASVATTARAQELQVDFLFQGKGSKREAVEAILQKAGCDWDDICYLGDDVVDLAPLKRAGLSVAVANAIPEAKALAHYTTQAEGGHGAVREVVELILIAQKKWAALIKEYAE